ncbi:hypothetical protein ADUPG1_010088 [Aduncisulcus paluster]|uniref:Uncharacterized protein n=1 Tax=Aduncisulcus paluster TaxID=2918883 RepID=A0ABQ5KXV2_9EUKA|nr:hypothetical protein ADUPG1_011629 [Aduncisulcus paluster]GKT37268.1 hypothetical protein ADUPG1_010088 [Aduncisulcus paluster]
MQKDIVIKYEEERKEAAAKIQSFLCSFLDYHHFRRIKHNLLALQRLDPRIVLKEIDVTMSKILESRSSEFEIVYKLEGYSFPPLPVYYVHVIDPSQKKIVKKTVYKPLFSTHAQLYVAARADPVLYKSRLGTTKVGQIVSKRKGLGAYKSGSNPDIIRSIDVETPITPSMEVFSKESNPHSSPTKTEESSRIDSIEDSLTFEAVPSIPEIRDELGIQDLHEG